VFIHFRQCRRASNANKFNKNKFRLLRALHDIYRRSRRRFFGDTTIRGFRKSRWTASWWKMWALTNNNASQTYLAVGGRGNNSLVWNSWPLAYIIKIRRSDHWIIVIILVHWDDNTKSRSLPIRELNLTASIFLHCWNEIRIFVHLLKESFNATRGMFRSLNN
jgi:hypothetical protein